MKADRPPQELATWYFGDLDEREAEITAGRRDVEALTQARCTKRRKQSPPASYYAAMGCRCDLWRNAPGG
jgi:hypothetical protein